MQWPASVGGTQPWAQGSVYISKLHRPTCAHANVVVFSILESIPDILSPSFQNEAKLTSASYEIIIITTRTRLNSC